MAKAWTDKREYGLLKAELATSSDRAFERAVVPFLRIVFPELVSPPARRDFDCSGCDHLVWSDTLPHQLVVQCKGFEKHEYELGAEQLAQCAKSIRSFRDSGLTTRKYIIVHNRIGKDPGFRTGVLRELKTLVEAGCAQVAELWDVDNLLQRSFNATYDQLRALAAEQNLSTVQGYADAEPELCEPLHAVPLQVRIMTADQYKLAEVSPPIQHVADPTHALLDADTRFSLLIGYAGFGKTTSTLRLMRESRRRTFFVPAAVFSDRMNATKELLEQCVDVERLVARALPEEQATFRRIARPAIEHLFKKDDGSFLLLLDGIDESYFLAQRGGLQHLFNALRLVGRKVILTVRKEYFESRIADFATSFGLVTERKDRLKKQRITVIELLPWSDQQILQLVNRYASTIRDAEARQRLASLAEAVASGQYQKFYGDIPRRPLFLRFILETVEETGIHLVSRASLFTEWARLKIIRDITRPAKFGGQRLPIADDRSVDDTVQLAFGAMAWAARCMTTVTAGIVEILPTCRASEVLAFPGLKDTGNAEGLILNSLLVPAAPRRAPEPLEVCFAHRAYQEFFLARYVLEEPEAFPGAALPHEIQGWLGASSTVV